MTFQDEFGQLDCVTGAVQEKDLTYYDVSFGAFDQSARTLKLTVVDALAAAADLTLDVNNRVHVSVTVRDSVEEGYR